MIVHIRNGNFSKAALSVDEFLWNVSGIGTVVNISKEIASSETFQKGFKEGTKDKYKLNLATIGKPTIPDFSKFAINQNGALIKTLNQPVVVAQVSELDSKPEGQGEEVTFGNTKANVTGRPLEIHIDALMKDFDIHVNNDDTLEEFKGRLSSAMIDVVKDVEVSYN